MSKIAAFVRGLVEFRSDFTWADEKRSAEDPYTSLDEAYDWGREWAHRITFRYFDQ